MSAHRSVLSRICRAGWLAACLTLASTCVHAEDFPARTVRVIVQTAAGSSLDALARLLDAQLSQIWGKEVIVVNQAGAGGLNAARAASAAVPDGYTLFLAGGSVFVALPELQRNLPFDVNDFRPDRIHSRTTLRSSGVEAARRDIAGRADRALQKDAGRPEHRCRHARWTATFDRGIVQAAQRRQSQHDPLSGNRGVSGRRHQRPRAGDVSDATAGRWRRCLWRGQITRRRVAEAVAEPSRSADRRRNGSRFHLFRLVDPGGAARHAQHRSCKKSTPICGRLWRSRSC